MAKRPFITERRRSMANGLFSLDGRPKHSEEQIHRSIIKWIEIAAPKCLALHVPNGMPSNPITGSRFNQLGLKKGAPDLIVFAPNAVLCLEVKSESGRLSPDQKVIAGQLNSLGHFYKVVRSVNDVAEAFTALNINFHKTFFKGVEI